MELTVRRAARESVNLTLSCKKGKLVMSSKAEVVQLRPTDITPEERARRVQVEAERRARQSTVEWMSGSPASLNSTASRRLS